MFKDSSFELSDKSRGDNADFHVSNQIKSLSNPLDPNDRTDSAGCVSNIYSYNQDSRGKENEQNDYRNQLIDPPKLLRQSPLEQVDWERLLISTEATRLRFTDDLAPIDVGIVDQDIDVNPPRNALVPRSECIDDHAELRADSVAIGQTFDIVDDAEKKVADKSTTTCNIQGHADLIKRYCPKCEMLIADANVYKKQSCAKCETPLSYQCARCDKQYSHYVSLTSHLDRKCNTPNVDLKCPMCIYQTHSKTLMSIHLHTCLSGINFSCDLCEYTTRRKSYLIKHMKGKHRDICKSDCSQCKSKSSRCEQCKIMAPICGTCYTGFSSTGRFQEHQTSCKKPVLECTFCFFKTEVNKKLRHHIKVKHMMA